MIDLLWNTFLCKEPNHWMLVLVPVLQRCLPDFSRVNGTLTVANQTRFTDALDTGRSITELQDAARWLSTCDVWPLTSQVFWDLSSQFIFHMRTFVFLFCYFPVSLWTIFSTNPNVSQCDHRLTPHTFISWYSDIILGSASSYVNTHQMFWRWHLKIQQQQ